MIFRLIRLVVPFFILILVAVWLVGRLELRGLVPSSAWTLRAARASVWIGNDWASFIRFVRSAV